MLAFAASAGAVTGKIVVNPSSLSVGKNAAIRVQLSGATAPATLSLKVISPRGGSPKAGSVLGSTTVVVQKP